MKYIKYIACLLLIVYFLSVYYLPVSAADVYNVFEITSFTADDYNEVLKNTMLNGYGDIIYIYEHGYNISGLIILSFMRGETSFGGGYNGIPYNENALYKNNFFGIMYETDCGYDTRYFKTPVDSIRYFCELINSGYYKNLSLEEICHRYCPDDGYYEFILRCISANLETINSYEESILTHIPVETEEIISEEIISDEIKPVLELAEDTAAPTIEQISKCTACNIRHNHNQNKKITFYISL